MDIQLLNLASRVLFALDKIEADPEEAVTVALTRRDVSLISACLPLVAFSYPEAMKNIIDLDHRLSELVLAQRPDWARHGAEEVE